MPVIDSFRPDADARAFRTTLGSFATGVTVVTTGTVEGPVGITANSFASVSLDPPLVLWSPAKSSTRYGVFAAAEHFAIHVIGAEQKPVADAFTKARDAFDGLDWAYDPTGTPLINGTLARFLCRTEARHDAGDHLIVVGRVLAATCQDGLPLVFQGGAYGRFVGTDG